MEAARSATNAGRSVTSLVPAPNPQVLVLEALTTIAVTAVVVVAAAETTTLLEVEVERPGMIYHDLFN